MLNKEKETLLTWICRISDKQKKANGYLCERRFL